MIVGVLLAAGGGQRFGGPKAPYVFEGERLVDRGVRLLKESGCHEVIVVLGAWMGEVAGATLVRNEEWESGQASSLIKGLELIPPTAGRICILLVDQIGITSSAISKVIDSEGELVALGSGNLFSPPIAFSRQHLIPLISDLSIALADPQRRDSGARHYFQRVGGTVVQVEDISLLEDLDEKPNH